MSSFTQLPLELRQKIFLHALHCEYTKEAITEALRATKPEYVIVMQACITLSQRTLSSLKLVNRQTYYDAIEASKKAWLSYATIELLEEMEAIRECRYKLARQYKDASYFNRAESEDADRADDLRYSWISQIELSAVHHHRCVLEKAEFATLKRTRRGPEYLDVFYDFMELCTRFLSPGRTSSGRSPKTKGSGRLEMEQIVCFGAPGSVPRMEGRESVEWRWKEHGWLPQSWYSSELTDWYRPYRR